MEGIDFVFQPVILPKNGFIAIEKDILKTIGLLNFAIQVEWDEKLLKKMVQQVLLQLQEGAKTSILQGQIFEIIPQNYRDVFTDIFHLKSIPAMTDKPCLNQLVITKPTNTKTSNITSTMCVNQETKTI